jgi:hypothetical protein
LRRLTAGGMLTAYTWSLVYISDHTVSRSAGLRAIMLVRKRKAERANCTGGR